MKRVTWASKQVGDVFLSGVPGIVHDGIWSAEKIMHPDAPTDFEVSHAGIVGPYMGYVTEAWVGNGEGNSVACVVPWEKYDEPDRLRQVEVWRPDGATSMQIWGAFYNYLSVYVPEKYGLQQILGFEYRAAMRRLTGHDVENPMDISRTHTAVCSQGALLYLVMLCEQAVPSLAWTLKADVDNCDPLRLRMYFLANSVLGV